MTANLKVYAAVFTLVALVFPGAIAAQDETVSAAPARLNVLMIIADDLNHWVGHFGRNPDTRTPHMDALAQDGASFLHAYAAAPTCNPSRTALLGGRRPGTTGVYGNAPGSRPIDWSKYLIDGLRLPQQFKQAGYRVYGAGKVYHGKPDFPGEWTAYKPRQLELAQGSGVKNYDGYFSERVEGLRNEDIEDFHTTMWCGDRIEETGSEPFFLACGLIKPHLPFNVPDRFHDAFDPAELTMPDVWLEDHDDLSSSGKDYVRHQDFERLVWGGRWRKVVSNYLAAINYTDAHIGYLIEKLRASGKYDNTIIVVFGDHGWHLGEKRHFRKNTLWEEGTRTPYIWRLPDMAERGTRIDAPVDLMSLYPTLMELTGLPRPDQVEGVSVAPLLADPKAEWDHPAITTIAQGSNAVRMGSYRLIQYSDGARELYDHEADPLEWRNLAGTGEYRDVEQSLAALLPTDQAPAALEMERSLSKSRDAGWAERRVSAFNALLAAMVGGAALAFLGFAVGRRRA